MVQVSYKRKHFINSLTEIQLQILAVYFIIPQSCRTGDDDPSGYLLLRRSGGWEMEK